MQPRARHVPACPACLGARSMTAGRCCGEMRSSRGRRLSQRCPSCPAQPPALPRFLAARASPCCTQRRLGCPPTRSCPSCWTSVRRPEAGGRAAGSAAVLFPSRPPSSPQPPGTNNRELLVDPAYKGLRLRRLTGEAYEQLVAEFVAALKAWQPHVLLQFEVGAAWEPRRAGAGAAVLRLGPSQSCARHCSWVPGLCSRRLQRPMRTPPARPCRTLQTTTLSTCWRRTAPSCEQAGARTVLARLTWRLCCALGRWVLSACADAERGFCGAATAAVQNSPLIRTPAGAASTMTWSVRRQTGRAGCFT